MVQQPAGPAPPGMVWIPGGVQWLGSEDSTARPDEGPVHQVTISGFWMDETEVTNAQFRQFVEATGYETTAEIAPKLEDIMAQLPPGSPPPDPADLVPGSLVFTVPDPNAGPVANVSWWSWKAGANWRHPNGPGSRIDGKDNHPVRQVSYADIWAYARWAKKSIPTEAQWEYAARGGEDQLIYVWGNARFPDGPLPCNIWQGPFPTENTREDGYYTTAPVKSYAANGYGLYDMAGNVWEWCSDWYQADYYQELRRLGVAHNPAGPKESFDPMEPTVPKRVTRGGSYLCSDVYCTGFRPSARMKTSPDTSLIHTGFRCVMTQERWLEAQDL